VEVRVICDPETWMTLGTTAYQLRHGTGQLKTCAGLARGKSWVRGVRWLVGLMFGPKSNHPS
jgi:hypothetical protein